MPKIIEYPRASLRASLDLAKHISELGGSAKVPTVAEKMGSSVSGAFAALISSAGKFSLVSHSSGTLSTTPLYREYRLAYSEDDAIKVLQKAFLSVPLFQKVYSKFLGQKLPLDILNKLLVREYQVDEVMASRVATYLVDAARAAKLIDDQNVFVGEKGEKMDGDGGDDGCEGSTAGPGDDETKKTASKSKEADSSLQFYTVQFSGPGINSTISIREAEDLDIVEATLKKIKRKMGEASSTPPIQ